MRPNNDAKLQEALFNIGAYKGIKNRKGTELTYEQAVDGIFGNMSQQAVKNAEAMGYIVDRANGTISKKSNTTTSSNKGKRPITTSGANFPSQIIEQAGTIPSITNEQDSQLGHAIYLQYPNFMGSTANAAKIGNVDIGKELGNALGISQLPVGHAATIIIDPNGKSTYYEYGRYADSGFGHVRPTTKGGNWRRIELPIQNKGENDSAYVARIQHLLPDTKTGAYQAMTLPNIDTSEARQFIISEANDKKRPEYSIFNTCADGACRATLPFLKKPEYHPENGANEKGYSLESRIWSSLSGLTTGGHASDVRKHSNKVYIMNQ